jgi:hypothetical protein
MNVVAQITQFWRGAGGSSSDQVADQIGSGRGAAPLGKQANVTARGTR